MLPWKKPPGVDIEPSFILRTITSRLVRQNTPRTSDGRLSRGACLACEADGEQGNIVVHTRFLSLLATFAFLPMQKRSQPIPIVPFFSPVLNGLAPRGTLQVPGRVGLASEAALQEVDLTSWRIAVLFSALLSIQA